MANSSRLSTWCDRVIEAGWIAAVVLVPLFFNIYSSRVFEPDKLTLLRSIALVMVAAWLVRTIEEWVASRKRGNGRAGLTNGVTWRTPLVLPTLLLVAVYLVATIFSITPYTSLFGSYQRLQGTYTTFSYIVVFFMILMGLRRRRQLDRLVTAIVMTSMPIAFYGLLQRGDGTTTLDPLPWGGDVISRVAANMGNAIFIAAYLIMAFFLTLGRVIEAFRIILTEEESRWSDILRASAYIFVGAVQLIAFAFAESRGPLLGWLPGMFVLGLVGLLLLRVTLQSKGEAVKEPIPVPVAPVASAPSPMGTPRELSISKAETSAGLVNRLTETDILKAIALSLTSIIVAAIAGYLVYSGFPGQPQITLAAVATLIGGLVPLLVVAGIQRRAARWLWSSWIFFSIVGAAGIFLVNFSDHPKMVELRQSGTFGSLGTLFESEGGTGRVRTLIWEGAVELIEASKTLTFPDDTPDALGGLRPLIGYGPEAMYVAYNKFYPPDLAHYEARNASPDRSHNETLDSFVITGLIGFLAEQFLFISAFFFAIKFIGWVPSRRAATAFVGMMIAGGVAGAIGLGVVKGVNFMGTGWPGGVTAGLLLYVTLFALFHFQISTRVYAAIAAVLILVVDVAIFAATFTSPNRAIELIGVTTGGILAFAGLFFLARRVFTEMAGQPIAVSGHVFVIIALFGGILAHYLEISLAGIAIAATRTYFWTFAALLVVTGLNWVPADDAENVAVEAKPTPAPRPAPANLPHPARKKRKAQARLAARPEPRPSITRTAPSWIGPTIALALIGALILGTLGYEFITAPPQATDVSTTGIIWNSLTLLPYQENRQSPGTLLMFAVTWIFGAVISLTELRRRDIIRPASQWQAILTYAGVSLGVSFLFWLIHSGRLITIINILIDMNTVQATSINHLIDRYLALAEAFAGGLGMFYLFVFGLIAALGFSLLNESRARALPAASEWGAISAVPVFLVAALLLVSTNFNPIRADIIFKQGQPWVNGNACNGAGDPVGPCDVAIGHLKQALKYAPNEDFYMLSLGASYLNKSAAAPSASAERPSLLLPGSTFQSIVNLDAERTAFLNRDDALTAARVTLEHARDINPLNTDHSANLARLHRRWADLAAGDAERQLRLDQAGEYYRQATTLSPHNAQLWNEWAQVFTAKYVLSAQLRDQASANADNLEAQNDATGAEAARQEAQKQQAAADAAGQEANARLDESLRLDQEFADTYIALGDLYRAQNKLAEAEQALRTALEKNPQSADAWARLTEQFLATGSITEAENLTVDFLNTNPTFLTGWRTLVQNIYVPQNRIAEAIEAARRSVELAASDPNLWQDQLLLAQLLQAVGSYAEALPYAQAALDSAPPEQKTQAQSVYDAIQAAINESSQAPGP